MELRIHKDKRGETMDFHEATLFQGNVIGKDHAHLTHYVLTFLVGGIPVHIGIPFCKMKQLRQGIEELEKSLAAEGN